MAETAKAPLPPAEVSEKRFPELKELKNPETLRPVELIEKEVDSLYVPTWMRTGKKLEQQLYWPIGALNIEKSISPENLPKNLVELFKNPNVARAFLLSQNLLKTPNFQGGLVYIWPTRLCPLGCSHCMFGAPKSTERLRGALGNRLTSEQADKAIQFTNDMKADVVALSGGGEPLEERDTTFKVIRETHATNIHLITNSFWAGEQKGAAEFFDELEKNFQDREASKLPKAKFVLKLSLDEAHLHHLPMANMHHILTEFLARNFAFDFELRMKSIFKEDKAVAQFVKELQEMHHGAKIEEINPYKVRILLAPGKEIFITFKNSVPSGRGKVAQTDGITANYNQGYVDFITSQLPHKKINPTNQALGGDNVEYPNGANYTIEYDGSTKLLEGSPLDNVPNIDDFNFVDAQAMIFKDPISYLSRLEGPEAIYAIAAEIDAQKLADLRYQNALYYNLERLLDTPNKRVYATIRAFQVLKSTHPEIFKEEIDDPQKKFWLEAEVPTLKELLGLDKTESGS